MNFTVPEGLHGKELFAFLKKNKNQLIAEKKMAMKKADACSFYKFIGADGKVAADKAAGDASGLTMKRTLVINTTNLMDSTKDVHIPGLWKKSLKESKLIYLLQEHEMKFSHIISDDVKAYTKTMMWRELDWEIPGTTEALLFEADITPDRNKFMYDQYASGYVKQHSVGMMYVTLLLAVNEPEDPYYKEEYENWQKYISEVANYEDAEASGYFWPVLEAKIVEGSAVPLGANWMTPDITGNKSNYTEGNQPPHGTGTQQPFDVDSAIKGIKILI